LGKLIDLNGSISRTSIGSRIEPRPRDLARTGGQQEDAGFQISLATYVDHRARVHSPENREIVEGSPRGRGVGFATLKSLWLGRCRCRTAQPELSGAGNTKPPAEETTEIMADVYCSRREGRRWKDEAARMMTGNTLRRSAKSAEGQGELRTLLSRR